MSVLDALAPLPRSLFDDVVFKRIAIDISLGRPADHRTLCPCGDKSPHFRFHFFHGGVLRALIGTALESHEMPLGLAPFACESGRHPFATGDTYRFGVTLAGASVKLEDQLIEGLTRLGRISPKRGGAVLGGNFAVKSVTTVTHQTLADFCGDHAATPGATILRALSPLRVPQPPDNTIARGKYLDRSSFPLAPLLSRMIGRVHAVARGVYPEQAARASLAAEPPADLHGAPGGVMWLDVPIGDTVRDDPSRPNGYKLGGIVGTILLERLPPEWLPWMLAAEALHVGENTHFGLGAVSLSPFGAKNVAAKWCAPAQTLLDCVVEPGEIEDARAWLTTAIEQREGDDVQASEVVERIRRGHFHAAPLRGWAQRMEDGRVRGFAISPTGERIVQRAAAQVLAPTAQMLLADCSFAYRKGYSIVGAKREIVRALRDGFQWVLDADIRAFFDTVDLDRLERILGALLPDEPLVPVLMSWVRAPVRFGDTTIERVRGLPQGLAISPVLANLYLDELDEALLGEKFRLVRYADDFVVLCRDEKEARRALTLVNEVVTRLGLTLHEDKTRLVSSRDSFTFLGHLFRSDGSMHDTGADDDGRWRVRPLSERDVPVHSWLASVPLAKLRRLVRVAGEGVEVVDVVPLDESSMPLDAGQGVPVSLPSEAVTPAAALRGAVSAVRRAPVPLKQIDAYDRRMGRPLYVMRSGVQVRLRLDVVQVVEGDAVIIACPVRALAWLAVRSSVSVSQSALLRLADAGVPVFFVRASGRLRATVAGLGDWSVWEAQARVAASDERRVEFARVVLSSRISRQRDLLRAMGAMTAEREASFVVLLEGLKLREQLDELRGTEGQASKLLFGALREKIAPAWLFHGRVRRPPPDPVNVMLSYGYTILYQCVVTAVTATGCNPRIGLLHDIRAGHDAFASDLQEEWRHVIETLVWRIAETRAPWEGFTADGGACLMSFAWRREFTALVLDALCREADIDGFDSVSALEQIGTQAIRAREWMTGHATTFVPGSE